MLLHEYEITSERVVDHSNCLLEGHWCLPATYVTVCVILVMFPLVVDSYIP